MIVRDEAANLLLITQPDHAGLSARIMAAWRADGLPERESRPTVLLATREHDNGWVEVDAAPTVDPTSGRPYDFANVPHIVKQGIWPRALARWGPDRPDVASLIAQHALTIFRGSRDDPQWRTFFDTIEKQRNTLLARCGVVAAVPHEGFMRDYQAVFLGDLLSLIFCNGWTDPFEAEGYRIILDGTTLRIAPDPFGEGSVPLQVNARRIPARRYVSSADLREELARAAATEVAGVAVGEPQERIQVQYRP